MRRLADLNLNRLTIPDGSDMGSALLAMQKAGVSAAAVLDGNRFCGFVTIESAILSDPDTPVRDFLRSASFHLQADEPVRQASKRFVQQQADFLAVFDGNRFVGILSALMLITELGRSYDPLTGLSWSDALRDWGVDRLEAGQEICIAFFDLDDFGVYNKRYGHVLGDSVLKEFATLLSGIVDQDKDVLVRYGGDEFALATMRPRSEVEALLGKLGGLTFTVPGMPAPVGFSYGLSGGKRTTEPSRDHVAATLDNLISLASKDCLARKPHRGKVGTERDAVQPETSDWHEIAHQAARKAGEAGDCRIEILDTLFVLDDDNVPQVVITGISTIGGREHTFRAVRMIGANLEKAIQEAVWEGALLC